MAKMESLVNFLVEKRMIFLYVFIGLFVASFVGWYFTEINYDFISYLPKDSTIIKSINVMGKQFNARGAVSILVTNMKSDDRIKIMNLLSDVDGIANVVVSSYSKEKQTGLVSIFLVHNDYNIKTEDTVKEVEKRIKNYYKDTGTKHELYRTGSAATAIASRHSVEIESLKSLGIALIFVIIVLLITTKSWIEPVVLLIVIGAAIIVNYGTNIIMRKISFVSNSISAVLLVALSMDYSIVLVSRFREEREKIEDDVQAMKNALSGAIITIISSGCTVMAGLLSLVTMKNKIGLDLGLVLTKGVLISLTAVILLMPSILLLFSKLIKKTEHMKFLPNMKKVGTFAKFTRYAFPIIFACIAIGAIVLQEFKLKYVFNPVMETDEVRKAMRKTADVFDVQNQMVIIMPFAIDVETQINISTYISHIKTKKQQQIINSNSTYMSLGFPNFKLGSLFYKEYIQFIFQLEDNETDWIYSEAKSRTKSNDTAYAYEIINAFNHSEVNKYFKEKRPDIMKVMDFLIELNNFAHHLFNSETHTRMIFNIKSNVETDDSKQCITDIKEYLNKVIGKDSYNIISQTDNCIETKRIFKTDKILVDSISACAVLFIVMIATRSVAIPIVLVLLIEGSIYINLTIQALAGKKLYFIVYLLGIAIQMGSTIDYGILLTDRYVDNRKRLPKYHAITAAIDQSFPTMISSGSILTLIAFTLGVFCHVDLISSIGILVCVGTLMATLTMLFMLPQYLLLTDFIIEKTTYKSKFVSNNIEVDEENESSFIANESDKPLFQNEKSVDESSENDEDKKDQTTGKENKVNGENN